jgi:hypothetical protein
MELSCPVHDEETPFSPCDEYEKADGIMTKDRMIRLS